MENESVIAEGHFERIPVVAGYRQEYSWHLDEHKRELVLANVAGLLALPLVYYLFHLIARTIAPPAAAIPRLFDLNRGVLFVSLLFGSVMVVLLHEAVHGLVMRIFGARPRFGIEWQYGVAYATAPGHLFTRNQFVVVALAPLATITLSGLLLFMLWRVPAVLAPGLLFMLALNLIGAMGDMWMTWLCLRYSVDARVLDEKWGIRIYLPE